MGQSTHSQFQKPNQGHYAGLRWDFLGEMFMFYLTLLIMFTRFHPEQAAEHFHLYSAPKQSICI